MNKLAKIGTTVLTVGCVGFAIGIGGMMFANNDKESVTMPIQGCWTRMEGSKHNVSEHFYCRFLDQRVNENVDIAYHPLAYKEMSSYPIGTKFAIEAESMQHKKSIGFFVPTFLVGVLAVIVGLVMVIVGEATSRDKRW